MIGRRLSIALFALAWAAGPVLAARTVVPLDGTWQIAQGGMDAAPAEFAAAVPVPGLVDMAKPAFAEIGVASKQRQAFWYHRTFRLDGPKRPVALLKVNKAQFGTKVWLNGAEAGEHAACFTPGYFDVSKLVRYGQENTLVIRVGAYRDALPPSVPTNTDYEQARWIPGIYDSVSLLLLDGAYIANVQIAPRLSSGTALVQLTLRNAGAREAVVPVRLSARAWKSGRSASTTVSQSVSLGAGEERAVTVPVPLQEPRLWSPEDPFLYVMRCRAGADALETRFGMREFRYDTKTGHAMLNGRPYFLRGTNFCMFRFFEDPARAGLPWDRAWVRKLLALPREALHLNSARVCIAPFPEFWYDIADEQGWLLQDEFPIWGFKEEWSQQELEEQFREWLRERWNHPSIAIWDACNETLTPRTGKLIGAVRDMDLSGRPWDDGYSGPNRPGDAVEDHPYRFMNKDFRLEDLGSALDGADGLRKPPVVINEYDWLWIDRQGQTCTLTQQLYDSRLGANATPEQRREFCAYNNAAMTEYWRARRKAAGVMHFCYLTYSRPRGQTSDDFVDVAKLTLEPRFLQYMRDAFSPVGVMIDDFAEKLPPGGARAYRVIVTNDLDRPQSGTIRLRFLRPDGSAAAERQSPFRVDALGQSVQEIQVSVPAPGAYRLVAEMRLEGGGTVQSRRDVQVVTAEEARAMVSIATGCKATASSEIHDDRGDFPASFAVDGKAGTRWSSEFADPQWLALDLGREHTVGRVQLSWEGAYGKAYRIEVSDDNTTWRTVYETRDGKGGREELKFDPVTARYLRLYGAERGTQYGYSLWEVRVFER